MIISEHPEIWQFNHYLILRACPKKHHFTEWDFITTLLLTQGQERGRGPSGLLSHQHHVPHRHFSGSKAAIKEATFLYTAGIEAKIKYILHFPTRWQLAVFVVKLFGKCFVKEFPIRKRCFFRAKHQQEHDCWCVREIYFPVAKN